MGVKLILQSEVGIESSPLNNPKHTKDPLRILFCEARGTPFRCCAVHIILISVPVHGGLSCGLRLLERIAVENKTRDYH